MTVDIERLPVAARPLMRLCLTLSPSQLRHHAYVADYLQVNETALAMELIIAGAEPDLTAEERSLIAEHMKDAYVDLWAAPGTAEEWVAERCKARDG